METVKNLGIALIRPLLGVLSVQQAWCPEREARVILNHMMHFRDTTRNVTCGENVSSSSNASQRTRRKHTSDRALLAAFTFLHCRMLWKSVETIVRNGGEETLRWSQGDEKRVRTNIQK